MAFESKHEWVRYPCDKCNYNATRGGDHLYILIANISEWDIHNTYSLFWNIIPLPPSPEYLFFPILALFFKWYFRFTRITAQTSKR